MKGLLYLNKGMDLMSRGETPLSQCQGETQSTPSSSCLWSSFLTLRRYVDAVISRLLFELTEQAVLDTSEGSSLDEDEEGDFFKALMSPGPTATEGTNSICLCNKMGKELESWCSE
ncbi:hypothetical protein GWK47_030534 [Chionoecetes opilio]|uniref:Uncharacterized protein n=1 Tax=Chionoecetes opilio TaxID=41210 RepID=A0A8J4YKU4_CHIOP|nr:hypothetical protein GWK47_030534 [Chionoecetes opilio]